MHGYGEAQYTNVRFAFPIDPPHIHAKNPCGLYVLPFTHKSNLNTNKKNNNSNSMNNNARHVLHFEGVDSCCEVWLNGRLVGTAKGSRLPCSFDISDALNVGAFNILVLIVHTYCEGSYLEDQDHWALSGIHREVWIQSFTSPYYISDYHTHTVCSPTAPEQLHIQVRLDKTDKTDKKDKTSKHSHSSSAVTSSDSGSTSASWYSVDAVLFDNQNREIARDRVSGLSQMIDPDDGTLLVLSMRDLNHSQTTQTSPLRLWSAEIPTCYRLILSITIDNQVLQVEPSLVGFRRVEIDHQQKKFLVNGKPVILRGVNYHEHSDKCGKTVPYASYVRDIVQIKTCNFNAIRGAHYPHHPCFLHLCDYYGLYAIDEANIESHGLWVNRHKRDPDILKLEDGWHHAFHQRVSGMVERDKNHCSVIMWSLGNESWYTSNHVVVGRWLRHRLRLAKECIAMNNGNDNSNDDSNTNNNASNSILNEWVRGNKTTNAVIVYEPASWTLRTPKELQELVRENNEAQQKTKKQKTAKKKTQGKQKAIQQKALQQEKTPKKTHTQQHQNAPPQPSHTHTSHTQQPNLYSELPMPMLIRRKQWNDDNQLNHLLNTNPTFDPNSTTEEVYTDVYFPMYTRPSKLRKKEQRLRNLAPVILCEYAHAQGNSLGNLWKYHELFEDQENNFQGGFVWEWMDQGLLVDTLAKSVSELARTGSQHLLSKCSRELLKKRNNMGAKDWLYGGDFGPSFSDRQSCLDGLVFPDGAPKPSLREIAFYNQPVGIVAVNEDEHVCKEGKHEGSLNALNSLCFRIRNRYHFVTLNFDANTNSLPDHSQSPQSMHVKFVIDHIWIEGRMLPKNDPIVHAINNMIQQPTTSLAPLSSFVYRLDLVPFRDMLFRQHDIADFMSSKQSCIVTFTVHIRVSFTNTNANTTIAMNTTAKEGKSKQIDTCIKKTIGKCSASVVLANPRYTGNTTNGDGNKQATTVPIKKKPKLSLQRIPKPQKAFPIETISKVTCDHGKIH